MPGIYLKPHLGGVPLDRLRVADVDPVFDAIDAVNELISQAAISSCVLE